MTIHYRQQKASRCLSVYLKRKLIEFLSQYQSLMEDMINGGDAE
jgi:hypothetical protein